MLCKIVPPCGGVGRKTRNRSKNRNKSQLAEFGQKVEMGFGRMEIDRLEVRTNVYVLVYIVRVELAAFV